VNWERDRHWLLLASSEFSQPEKEGSYDSAFFTLKKAGERSSVAYDFLIVGTDDREREARCLARVIL
jgi:hypothetical protein